MSEFKNDTFLARWINNELSDEELSAFKQSAEYAIYEKIRKGSELIDAAQFDEPAILQKIKDQRRLEIGKSKPNRKLWVISAAASIVILLSVAFYNVFFSAQLTTYQTAYGEKLNVELPDGSTVLLNSNTTLSFSEREWEYNRELTLKGEGYFDVKTGKRFVVHTTIGDVSVLGTQFTVQELDDFFEVMCFEGSVKVTSNEEEEILKPKTGVRKLRGTRLARRNLTIDRPSILINESSFEGVPLKFVLKELNNQYGITFEGEESFEELLFNGSFPHDSLDLALKIVLDAVNVNYEKKGSVIVLNSN